MANRFRAAVKTTTIKVRDFEYETRLQGHGSIIRAVAAHEGLDAIIEDAIDALVKRSKGKAGSTAEIMKAVMADLESTDLSVGAVAAKVISAAPDLAAELIAAGAVLQDGETIDDFIGWLESLTLSEVVSVGIQWYRFNFEGGLGPFVEEIKALFGKAPGATAAPPSKTAPAKPMGLRRGV